MSTEAKPGAVSDEELKAVLEVVFRANSQIYAERGFQRRIGYGKRPALLVIDMANAWTRPSPGRSTASAGRLSSTVARRRR